LASPGKFSGIIIIVLVAMNMGLKTLMKHSGGNKIRMEAMSFVRRLISLNIDSFYEMLNSAFHRNGS
jgi:hypothetical protein